MFAYFTLFGRQISMYFIMALLGSFAFYFTFRRRCSDNRFRKDQLLHIVLAAAGGGFVGGHLLYFLTRFDLLLSVVKAPSKHINSFVDFLNVLSALTGGMVFYGGLFGALAGGYLYCRALKLDFRLYLDAATPAIPLFHAFGRIGCFFGGCCYGVQSHTGVRFPYSMTADPTKTYFPIQIVEAFFNLLLFVFLLYISGKITEKGVLFWIYGVCYSLIRFSDEFFRGDDVRGKILLLSTSQIISILFFAVSLIMIVRIRRQSENIKKQE